MKRKIIITILCLTMGLSIVACGKQENTATTESVSATIESTQPETESTEEVESSTSENTTEAVEEVETTENAEEIIETTDIVKGEPLSEKDLACSFLGYDTYNEYVEAGNDGGAYIVADNAAMILSGEFTDDGDVLESTVRGIKLGDSIDKVLHVLSFEDAIRELKNIYNEKQSK